MCHHIDINTQRSHIYRYTHTHTQELTPAVMGSLSPSVTYHSQKEAEVNLLGDSCAHD